MTWANVPIFLGTFQNQKSARDRGGPHGRVLTELFALAVRLGESLPLGFANQGIDRSPGHKARRLSSIWPC